MAVSGAKAAAPFPKPVRHALEDWRNTPGILWPANLRLSDQPTKYRPFLDARMLQPNL
jgi:hypothetical protein